MHVKKHQELLLTPTLALLPSSLYFTDGYASTLTSDFAHADVGRTAALISDFSLSVVVDGHISAKSGGSAVGGGEQSKALISDGRRSGDEYGKSGLFKCR
jgi:hypothetical protein